jgi:hypothetical protein
MEGSICQQSEIAKTAAGLRQRRPLLTTLGQSGGPRKCWVNYINNRLRRPSANGKTTRAGGIISPQIHLRRFCEHSPDIGAAFRRGTRPVSYEIQNYTSSVARKLSCDWSHPPSPDLGLGYPKRLFEIRHARIRQHLGLRSRRTGRRSRASCGGHHHGRFGRRPSYARPDPKNGEVTPPLQLRRPPERRNGHDDFLSNGSPIWVIEAARFSATVRWETAGSDHYASKCLDHPRFSRGRHHDSGFSLARHEDLRLTCSTRDRQQSRAAPTFISMVPAESFGS